MLGEASEVFGLPRLQQAIPFALQGWLLAAGLLLLLVDLGARWLADKNTGDRR